MITADQIVAHLAGDYILQSHWMATEKTQHSFACLCHVATYAIPFVIIGASPWALGAIVGSHFVIDRWRLARYVVWVKNWMGPNASRDAFTATGYPADTPPWLAVWLLIIVDNIMHLLCNGLALRYL